MSNLEVINSTSVHGISRRIGKIGHRQVNICLTNHGFSYHKFRGPSEFWSRRGKEQRHPSIVGTLKGNSESQSTRGSGQERQRRGNLHPSIASAESNTFNPRPPASGWSLHSIAGRVGPWGLEGRWGPRRSFHSLNTRLGEDPNLNPRLLSRLDENPNLHPKLEDIGNHPSTWVKCPVQQTEAQECCSINSRVTAAAATGTRKEARTRLAHWAVFGASPCASSPSSSRVFIPSISSYDGRLYPERRLAFVVSFQFPQS